MLKAIIVEDEYLAREELAYLVGQHSTIEIVASFEDGLEAFKYLQDHEVDVVFLDIQIPPLTACCWPRTCTSRAIRPTSCSLPPTRSLRWRRLSWRRSTTSSNPTTNRASSVCCKSSSWLASRRRGRGASRARRTIAPSIW